MPEEDEFARLKAEADQLLAGLRDYAKSLWTLYSGLVEEGFTGEQAFTLTRDALVTMMGGLAETDE